VLGPLAFASQVIDSVTRFCERRMLRAAEPVPKMWT
jgi:hypothetical protein